VFYTSIRRFGNQIFHRGYNNGEQFIDREEYKPTLFIASDKLSEWKSFYDRKNMIPYKTADMAEAYQQIREGQDYLPVHGNSRFEYQYLVENYPTDVNYEFEQIRIANIDIEVGNDETGVGFPDAVTADRKITTITVEIHGKYYVFGLKSYTPNTDNIVYHESETEHQLLNKFLHFWNQMKPDVITGWNTMLFDIPYLYFRISNVMDEKQAKMLSPYGVVKVKSDKYLSVPYIDIMGIEHLDYLHIYRTFTFKRRESYKLDYIGEVELGLKKVDYSDFKSLSKLYENDFQKFVEYNIRDVEIIQKLEEKLGIIHLITTLAYITHVNFTDTLKQVRMWDAFLYYEMTKRKLVMPPYTKKSKGERYEGAYVKQPILGKHNWIVSFDVNSLYPNLLRLLNISPETLRGKKISGTVNDYLSRKVDLTNYKDFSVAANGTVYDNSVDGLMPQLIRELYNKRIVYKERAQIAKQKLQQNNISEEEKIGLGKEVSVNNVLQMAIKVTLNSAYGALGSEYFFAFDIRMAEAITLTGQLAIRWVQTSINDYLNKIIGVDKDRCVAIDTDSNYFVMDDLVKKLLPNETDKNKIVTFLDKLSKQKIQPIIDQSFKDLSEYLHAKEPEAIEMDREAIADVGYWTAKKRYALNVLDMEGVRFKEPQMKLMGLETAKSSTPSIVRTFMEKVIFSTLNSDEDSTQKMIAEYRKEFKVSSIEDISFPRGVNNLITYAHFKNIYKRSGERGERGKGCPIHVRGSLLYNHYIKEYGLDNQFELIQESDKIKFVYLKEPNPIHENVIAFPVYFPEELNLNKYVDYDKMFEKTFVHPMQPIFEALNWSIKKESTLESFFS